ncbi:MAG TPA: SRPBCC family protein [Candidatus Thermoplasmatota archaeon]|nr:SRPBCC family protein [Candidatus Thermoplasmatota archaeon]
MTHFSEERDIAVPPDVLWRIVSDTKRWPQFYATPHEKLTLRSVEYLEGTTDGPGGKRRMHFLGVPSWDEQVSAWKENEFLAWVGTRNPGLKYWQQQMEIIPHKAGHTTLRWDVYFSVTGPRAFKKFLKRTMEGIVLSSLERIEKMALAEASGKAR